MRVGALIVGLFLFFTSLLWSQSNKKLYKQLQKTMEDAELWIEENEFYQPLEELTFYLDFFPNHPKLNFLIGFCHFALGHHDEAMKYLEKAYKSPPSEGLDRTEVEWWYAKALLLHEEPEKALTLFQRCKEEFVRRKQQAQEEKEKEEIKKWVGKVKEAELHISYCKNAIRYMANPVKVEIKNVGPMINSRYPDFGPVITADESEMLFTSRRPSNYGGIAHDGFHYEDIYISKRDEKGRWTKAENIGKPINTDDHDATIALSADGQVLFIYKDDNGGDIYFSELKGGEWTKPRNLNVMSVDKSINTSAWEPSVCMSADGKELFFVSDRKDEQGRRQRDIFYCYRLPNGKWSPAQRLPYPINTEYDEDAPFLHPDGKTLYFSSNRPESMGDFDIFYSVRDENGNWSEPVNLGYPINTTDKDIYFVMSADGRHGYYASHRKDSYGAKDIYLIDFSPMLAQKEEPEEKPKEEKPKIPIPRSTVTLLKGNVMNAKTKMPLEAKIVLIDLATQDTYTVLRSNARTGRYLVTMVPGKNYAIFAQATGYMDYSKNIYIPETQAEYQEIIEHIYLEPIAVGSRAILRNVFFDFDKATLRPESKVELDKWVKFLKDNPNIKIEIGGHTDIRGSDEYNMDLSMRRARAVYNYFLEHGIPAERMTYKGYGETQLLTTETTEEAHQLNRRVEIKIIAE